MNNSIVVREEEKLEEILGFAAKAGFKEVLIGFGSSDIFLRENYQADVERIKELLAKNGLSCKQTHLPAYHLTVSSEITDEQTELKIKRCIKASAELGAEWTTYHPRTAVNDGYNQTKSFEANKAILTDYLEDAEKYGIGIAVENMPLYPYTNAYWRFFGGGWEELCELCDSLKSDKIGICWDFGHAHTAALDQVAAIKDVGSRLKMTHVHDNYKNGDHHQLPLMGDEIWGPINWSETMGALKDINYNGSLALELIYPPFSMCESFIKLAHDCLEHLKTL